MQYGHISGSGEPRTGRGTQRYLTSAEGRITSLSLLAALCPAQPQRLFAFFATKAYCWLMFNLQSTRTPRTFSAKLLPRWLAPAYTAEEIIHFQLQDFTVALV